MFQVYLYITEKKIAGVVVTETLNQGYRMMNNKCCSETPTPAVCGVSRIWTLASYRRLKIATRLLDAMRYFLIASNLIVQYAFIYCDFVSRRSDFIYGKIIAVEEVAFSDPTDNGLSFAQSYTKRPDFIVYNM